MTRVLLIGLIVLAVLGAAGTATVLWLMRSADAARVQLAARQDYWTSELKAGIPLGAAKALAQHWLEDNVQDVQQSGAPLYNDDIHAFQANAEAVDAGGLHFPCSAWTITLDVTLGADDKVIRR